VKQTETTACVIELNILLHGIPDFITTGNALYYWFNSILGRYAVSTFVLVSDNYELVPEQKFAEQASRMQNIPEADRQDAAVALSITDEYCPPSRIINASAALIYNAICYLLNRVAVTSQHSPYPVLYATCPSLKRGARSDIIINGVHRFAGDNIILSKDAPCPPKKFVDGEGELIAWLWAAWFSRTCAGRRTIIVSIDTDNIGIAMLMKDIGVRNSVVIELKPIGQGKSKRRRYFDCRELTQRPLVDLKDMLLLYILGGGSDFCRGVITRAPIPKHGIITLLKHFAKYAISLQNEAGLDCFLSTFIPQQQLSELAPVKAAAFWNLEYWHGVLLRNAASLASAD
jgi:hypothetical protein